MFVKGWNAVGYIIIFDQFGGFLVILHRMDRLYWVDSQLDQVGHIDIQGSDRQTFINIGEITQPYSLTVYAGGFHDDGIIFCSSSTWLHINY